jgi:hypothetical protein
MSSSGRKVRAVSVWLTALMTLVSSFPHFDCRCPSGRLKRFCLSLTSSACCCGGSCCSPTQADRHLRVSPSSARLRPCCCDKSQGPRGKPSTADPAVGNASCVKDLIEPPPLTIGEARSGTDREPDAESLLPGPASGGFVIACTLPAHLGHSRDSPPPMDLVTLLRHLLI